MLKKTISKIMAVTMLISSIGQISLLNTVSAAEQVSTKDVWIDFQNYDSISDVPTDSAGEFFLQTTGTAVAEVATIDNNKSLKLVNVDKNNYNYFQVKFDQEATKTQKVVIEYDMMTFNEPTTEPKGQLKTEIHYNASSLKTAAMIQSTWKNSQFTEGGIAGSASVPVAGTWYHVKHELDCAKNTAYTIFTDREAGTKIYEKSVTNFTDYEYLRALGFHSSSSTGRTSYFDNIKIDYVYDVPNPEIEVYASDALQENLGAVSADTDTVKVNFNADMDETTVNGDNIYVVNTLTNEAVGADISYADGVATLALASGVHKGASYKVVVTDEATNPEGIGTAKEVEFTVENNSVNEDVLAQDLTIDFEGFESISDIPTDKNSAYYLDSPFTDTGVEQAVAEIVDLAGNKAIMLEAKAPSVSGKGLLNYRQFRVNIDEEASKQAKVVVEYDMMTNDPDTKKVRTELYYTGGAKWSVLTYMASNWKSIHNGATANAGSASIPADNEWYHVKHEFDVKTNTHTGIITKKADGTEIVKATKYNDTINSIYSVGLHCSSISGATSYYDNITVEYVYDEPKVTADSVKLYAEGVEQTDKAAVSQLTNSLTADFGTAMNADTLTNDTVYITNKATGAKIAATLDYANGVATLNFAEKLAKNTTYVLNIADTVKSALDVALAEYTPVEFTVDGDAVIPAETVGEDFVVDFENYDSIEGVPTDKKGAYYYSKVGTAAAEIVKTEENSYIKLPTVDGTNYTQFMVNIDPEVSKESEIIVEYDIMTEDVNSAIRSELYNGEGFTVLFYANGSNGWNALNGGQGKTITGVPAAGKWYHVKHVFNVAEQKFSAVYTEQGSDAALHSVSKYSVNADWKRASVDKITQIGLQCKSTKGTTAFDNIKVTYNYDLPTVTADSVTIINTESAEQTNWNNVSLLTKAVKVDFGTVMNTSTLTSENVYLENKATGEKVDTVLAYADGVLTMNLTEKLLATSVYKLVIKDAVTNIDGDKISEYTPLEFTTGESKRTAILTGLYKGSGKVTKLADVAAGDVLTVNVSYANSTSDAQTVNVLVAYYAGNALDHVELVKTENIAASVVTMNYTYNHTVSDLTDITRVKVFSWDALNSMVPLSESIVLE